MDNTEIATKINEIVSTLKSKEILNYLNQWQIDKVQLLKLIVESRTGYDQLMTDKKNEQIFKEFEESKVYSLSYYSELIIFISSISDTSKSALQNNNTLYDFYLFHKILSKTCNIILNFTSDPVVSNPVASTPVVSNPVASTPVSSNPVASTPVSETVIESVHDWSNIEGINIPKNRGKLLQVNKQGQVKDVSLDKFLKSLTSY